jgi:hypothetical protein
MRIVEGRLVSHIAAPADDAMHVVLEGTADMRSVGAMDELVRAAHAQAVAAKVKVVIIDLRALEFMSSSCFIRLVAWLSWIEESPLRYMMRIRSSRQHHWQKRSLHALRSFADALVVIDVD